MTLAMLLDRPPVFGGLEEDRSGGRGLTLEQRLDSVWEGLRADGAAECPVCHGAMRHGERFARCGDCGSKLA